MVMEKVLVMGKVEEMLQMVGKELRMEHFIE